MASERKHKHLRWHPRGSSSLTEHETPAHDPPLAPHDEAVFLLHVAAEVEHALMVQYLYAAYSLNMGGDFTPERKDRVHAWRATLLGIAREEKGHLITLQDMQRQVRATMNTDREG